MVECLYAHSTNDPSRTDWETLSVHLAGVARVAGQFANSFGWEPASQVAGKLHDIGKMSPGFQSYIAEPTEIGRSGPDHSTAGAQLASWRYGPQLGRMLAYAIAGHHGGLLDSAELDRRLGKQELGEITGWQGQIGDLPPLTALTPTRAPIVNRHAGFSKAFLTRMLFSCLVDADQLETEAFYDGRRDAALELESVRARLETHLRSMRRDDTALNRLRSAVLDHAFAQAGAEPGLFTLTVPTGGGKTLTSLAFALEHARLHDLRRVIYVIPYTSIIEQTAAVIRTALGTEVVEHHANFDWDRVPDGPHAADKLRKAAENWDGPIIVTTAVQFFESLFARQRSRCRKLHNIAGSVVVLDEAQTLPLRLLRPCMAALTELAANYRTSIVLCTATQPALRVCDGFVERNLAPREPAKKVGFDIDQSRELAPDPATLVTALKRVAVERRPDKTDDAAIVAGFASAPQMLCIVNTRGHARALFDLLRADPACADGARHLTTLMCPVHRRAVLAEVRARLVAGLPVRLVATSLIEAGVDIDFPEVWRALTGLDSIAQAAGRCNREGRAALGRVVVFEPAEVKPPRDLVPLIDSTEAVFRNGLDPLSLDAIRLYFQTLYWMRGADQMDAGTLDGRPWPILAHLADRAKSGAFDFQTISTVVRMIDDAQETVIVPYDDVANEVLARVAAMDRPARDDLRRLQQYAVSIPVRDRDAWLATGVLRAVHPALGEALLRFEDRAHYRDDTGVDLRAPERRDYASNIM